MSKFQSKVIEAPSTEELEAAINQYLKTLSAHQIISTNYQISKYLDGSMLFSVVLIIKYLK